MAARGGDLADVMPERVRSGETEKLGTGVETTRTTPPGRQCRAVLDQDARRDEVAHRGAR